MALPVGSSSNTYEILAKLAQGGMAEIFIARNATGAGVERLVVLKRMLPESATNQELAQMFIHEARLAAQLNHANIAKVFDVGKLGSSYFFTMEYVHGVTVRDLTLHARNIRAPIPLGALLTIAAGAAAGLHHAHERRGIDGKPLGIVHADVSPSNLMISDEGEVKLVDFGIARATGSAPNANGAVRGKISYLSPEQCHASRAIDRRSDLYSLGIVLWEMLTLQGLYRRASDFENMVAIESEPTAPPSKYRGDVPHDLDMLVMRMLEKTPAARFQTAAALLEEIERVAGQLRIVPSVTGLSRLVTDWFGQREPPWLESTRGGGGKRLVVATEPAGARGEHHVNTLAGPVDDQLKTLQPTSRPSIDIPGDTILDPQPGHRPKSESLEAMRDRLLKEKQTPKPGSLEALRDRVFQEVATRKTPQPPIDPEEASATVPRMPVQAVLRHETPRILATSYVGNESGPVSGSWGPPVPLPPRVDDNRTVIVNRRKPWALVVIAVCVIVISCGIVLIVASR